MTFLLALLGFAPTADQQRIPPIGGLLAVAGSAYGVAWVLDAIAWLLGPTLSPYLRVPGIICTALVVQSFVRFLVYRDGYSWAGWFRERLK